MTITVTSDRARMDLDVIHAFLSQEAYWAKNVPREVVERAVEHSLCFGAFDGDVQVGFARVITDRATFAYLADVFVLESHRGRGIAKQIMETIAEHPELRGLRRWHLVTRDAHALYAQFGFVPLDAPDRHMMKIAPLPSRA
ncbi:MAG TPA: GNAT family N-acetyltransferase [Thermoanaerobaculia bacterium]|jgi:GNAT superfamily N-acetyltransferase|nr:GNAT family N-acetyltransferase [Thermoanaerobaculia bacterium]